MLAILIVQFALLGQMSLADVISPPAEAQPAPAADAPATQPAEAGVIADESADNLLESFNRTRLGKIAQGQERVEAEQLIDPSFWREAINELAFWALGLIPRLIVAIVFLFLAWLVYRGIRKVIVGSLGRNVDPSIRDMLGLLIKWCVMGFGLVIAFNQVGIPIAALLVGVSIVGLAVGLAAQETLANFIAGVVIFWDKPFKTGDWIEIDGTFGEVKRVTFRSTRILDLDGEVVIFPNTSMLSSKISNHSTNPINRVNVPIGIAYKESIDQARTVLLALVKDDPRVCRTPEPTVVVNQCADSSVNLLLRVWVEDESVERVLYYELMERAKKALDAAGIQIPFPHMQLFIEDTPALNTIRPSGPELRPSAA